MVEIVHFAELSLADAVEGSVSFFVVDAKFEPPSAWRLSAMKERERANINTAETQTSAEDALVDAMAKLSVDDARRQREAESEVLFTIWKPDFIKFTAQKIGAKKEKMQLEWQMIDAKVCRPS